MTRTEKFLSRVTNFQSFAGNHILAENIFLVYKVRTHPSIYDLEVEASPLGLANADVIKEEGVD